MADLTIKQLQVLESLRKHDCNFLAAVTEEHWRKGEHRMVGVSWVENGHKLRSFLRRALKACEEDAECASGS